MDMSLDEVRTLLALERDLRALRSRCDGQDAHCHVIDALHAQADAQPAPAHRTGADAGTTAAKRHV
jgi:hypothetical protein